MSSSCSVSGSAPGSPDGVLRGAIAAVLGVLIASAAGHAWLHVDALDYAWLAPPCPFHLLAGVQCPGCGMTRAFLLLSQLRVGEAWRMNPAAPFLLAAMAWRLARPASWRVARPDRLAAAALLLVAGAWVARLA